ncbi:MAG: hypothetical protein ACUVQ8_01825 [Nitrososphaeria archaeon]
MTEQDPDIEELGILTNEKVKELAEENICTGLQLLLAPTDILNKHFSREELVNVLSLLQSKIKGVYRISDRNNLGSAIRVSTGSRLLDAKLGGGVTSGQITEICSEQRYPRTLLCYSILLRFLRERKDSRVLYNDPSATFRPEKLGELGSHYGLSPQEILDKISVFRPYTISQQMEIFKVYDNNLKLFRNKLLVVDGLGDFFGLSAEKKNIIYRRIRAMENFILRLNYLAAREKIIILFSNSTIQRFKDKVITPESDKIIGQPVKTRILIYRKEDATWEAKAVVGEESCSIPLSLSEYGLGDVP